MSELIKLYQRIVQRVNINLRELNFDVNPYAEHLIAMEQMRSFYAFYGITTDHPLDLHFEHSALAGSYFLGKCKVKNSILYKTDVRGDELKRKDEVRKFQNFTLTLKNDEIIDIEDCILIKTLIHNFSHDPETPERFFIGDTLSMDYANIHGAPTNGCFLGPFATVDLTRMRDCAIGAYSYIQAREISHTQTDPGTVWIYSPGDFNFLYKYPQEALAEYIRLSTDMVPLGKLIDFIEEREENFGRVFDAANLDTVDSIPDTSSLDRYAVILPTFSIGENVLISQRAYIENSSLGKGANAQENCIIVDSILDGYNVSAHGAKIYHAHLQQGVFTGFNSFICGSADNPVTIGKDSIVMPHTIIDAEEKLEIPDEHIVWGLVRNRRELATNCISLEKLADIRGGISLGNMHFEGNGKLLVQAFKDRIHHILEVNGAFFSDNKNDGHAQRNQKLSLNTIQPFQFGEMEGMYPSIRIRP
ncbi:transferase [Desulforhopalus singaporensis]|uniref:Carbonic anhydrase or acetyltransferase, isoleucine patch superfamily n=1 Tax=Desulforhopalus singaporensis TaxID=91360 RepID=A0A1H0L431_9BACT|nr:transferase [Desulforhopalus singaporensis]SDO62988.1 Carbonic anhydrase or acetyltransferase, isoleucine patch superfamily [Desulforhopalus singaporensis]